MRFLTSLPTIQEDFVYKEDDCSSVSERKAIRMDSINSFMPYHDTASYDSRVESELRLRKSMSGNGIIVKKCLKSGGFRYRRLTIMGKFLYMSSMFETKEIDIGEIWCARSKGKFLSIETGKYGTLDLKMSKVSDALAFSHIFG